MTGWPDDLMTGWLDDWMTRWQKASQTIDRMVYFYRRLLTPMTCRAPATTFPTSSWSGMERVKHAGTSPSPCSASAILRGECVSKYLSTMFILLSRLSDRPDVSIQLTGVCLHGGCVPGHSGHSANLAVVWIHQNENSIWPQKKGECYCESGQMFVRNEWRFSILKRFCQCWLWSLEQLNEYFS